MNSKSKTSQAQSHRVSFGHLFSMDQHTHIYILRVFIGSLCVSSAAGHWKEILCTQYTRTHMMHELLADSQRLIARTKKDSVRFHRPTVSHLKFQSSWYVWRVEFRRVKLFTSESLIWPASWVASHKLEKTRKHDNTQETCQSLVFWAHTISFNWWSFSSCLASCIVAEHPGTLLPLLLGEFH